MPLRIDILVGGKFETEWTARALLDGGHGVRLFTSFPSSQFPNLPKKIIHSFLLAEAVFRLGRKVGLEDQGDFWKMWLLDQMTARSRQRSPSDLYIGFSSFSLENLRRRLARTQVLVRNSAHILTQTAILREEYRKYGLVYADRRVCEERELEEYGLADFILVPSQVSKQTFVERGIPDSKISVLHLGVDTTLFKPGVARKSGPLRVVYFGNISIQKGVQYLLEATAKLPADRFELSLIGSVSAEFRPLLRRYTHMKYTPFLRHAALKEALREFDVFVFPTLHDGFGATLVQAMASGVVPVVTNRCGASDLVHDGVNGRVIAPADSEAIRQALEELESNRPLLAQMRSVAIEKSQSCRWEDYGQSLRELIDYWTRASDLAVGVG